MRRSCQTSSGSARSSGCFSTSFGRASRSATSAPILESIGDRAAITRDPALLAEYARQSLARNITAGYVDETKTLRAISLDPSLEQEIAESVTQTHEGEYLAMEPVRAQAVVGSLAGQVEQATGMGVRPVLVCSSRIRRHLRRLVEQALPQLPVVSYNEIVPGIRVETTGVVRT